MRSVMLNCGHCGRFVPHRQADTYAPWGGAADQEPPDPVDLCPACAEDGYRRTLARALRGGLYPYEYRPYYVPPSYWFRARSVARAMFRHGHPRTVRHERVRYETSGQRMVWWCACRRPERHPCHDPAESRRLSVTYHPFEKRHGRNIATVRVQEWCACGWTTGALVPEGPVGRQTVDYLSMGTLLREHIEAATFTSIGATVVAA